MTTRHVPPPLEVPPLIGAREIESELKKTIYTCFETARATKAALYLATSNIDSERFEIVTSYAYNAGDRALLDEKDPLVMRLHDERVPVIANSLGADERLGEVLFRQGHERLLAVPIFGRGRRLIGILDLRDKAAKKDFDKEDVDAARKVTEEIVKLLGAKGLYGVGPVSLVAQPRVPARPAAEPVVTASEPLLAVPDPNAPLSAAAQEAIRAARERIERRGVTFNAGRKPLASNEELEKIRTLLPAVLAVRGVAVAVLTGASKDARQIVVARGPLMKDAVAALQRNIATYTNRPQELQAKPDQAVTVLDLTAPSITAAKIRRVASAPLAPQVVEGLTLSVAFDVEPDAAARDEIEAFVVRFSEAIESALGRAEWMTQRQIVAEKLLEPDFEKFPGLVDHCRLVAGMAFRFTNLLGLAPEVAENVRLAALVHDVGLRLLDYDRISGRAELTEEQMQAVREHPLIGTALVEPVLGSEIAEAVLYHHERWDGTGYPGRVAGNKIPLASRIIALADAYSAMTSPWTYLTIVSPEEASERILRDAGTHFDPTLARRFVDAIGEIVV
jgi:hypothetical protein